jgi:tetratricopeptide (TPR) repeat protein/thiol-disulfide isomerase/thioredoxin/outer membrane lipoprotein-sorting protein
MRQKKYNEARVLLDAMLKTNPDSPDLLFQLGVVNLEEKKYKEAEDAFRHSYEMNPANSRGLMGMVETEMAQNHPDQAMQLLQTESAKAPNNMDLVTALGNTAIRAGRYDLAVSYFEKVAATVEKGTRGQGDIFYRIGEAYRRKGDFSNSIVALQKANELLPDTEQVLSTLALVLESAERWSEARQVYEAVLKLYPNNGVMLNNLAFLLTEHGGDLDDALPKAQRAKQLLPDMTDVSDTLAWIYLKKNLTDNAIEIFKELVSKAPDNSTYHFHLGMAYLQKGDKAKALEQFREALKYNPAQEEKDKILETIGRLESPVVDAQDTNRPSAGNPDADPSQASDPLVGPWVNQDQKPDLTQVNVRRDGARILAHVWGRCTPSDCDWGEEVVELRNGIGMVVWDQGFVTREMQLIPQPNGRLKVEDHSEYHDNSGRTDRGHAEFFTKQVAQKDDASVATARAVLRQVAERYRTLPAYFESIWTNIWKTGQSETRQVTRLKTYYLPPDRMRTERDDGREPFVTLADGKSEWTIYTAANEYRIFPQGKNLMNTASPDPIRGTPDITGHEVFDGVACTVIQLKLERGVTQTYWIEDERRVVRKWTVDAGEEPHIEVVYPVVRLGDAVKAELFTYDPEATHAKNRSLLSREARSTPSEARDFMKTLEAASLASIGKLAADFTLPDLDGNEVKLSSLRGKVVLLDFWATWCVPCRQQMPEFQRIHREFAGKDVVVLALDVNEPLGTVAEYIDKEKFTFPVLLANGTDVMDRYGVHAYPTTFAIDKNGLVADVNVGGDPDSASRLQALIEKARAGAPPPAPGSAPPPAVSSARSPAPPAPSATAEDFYRDAVRQHNSKDYAGAIQSLDRALELRPGWLLAITTRADNQYHLKRYDEAIAGFDLAIQLDPKRSASYEGRGTMYSNSGRHAQAIPDYTRAIELLPDSAAAHNSRGWAYLETGHLDEALADLNKALDLNPAYTTALFNRAHLFEQRKEYAKAIADFDSVLRVDPANTQAANQKAADLRRLQVPATTPKKPGSVAGAVTHSVTKAPVKNATVTLHNSRQGFAYIAVSDAAGVFRFQDVEPAGGYTLTAECPRYASVPARRAPPQAISVAEAQSVTGVALQLTPTGVISGKIVNEDGEPIPGTEIQANVAAYGPAGRSLEHRAFAHSDDRGEYRLIGLVPARYYISAVVRPADEWDADAGPDPDGRIHSDHPEAGYPPTLFPGVVELSGAAVTQIVPGGEVGGIDFRLRKVAFYHVRGQVVDLKAPVPAHSAYAMVEPCSPQGLSEGRGYYVGPDGSFDVPHITAGPRCLVVQGHVQGTSSYGRQTITVVDRDLAGVNLKLSPAMELKGSVVVEGPATDRLNTLQVSLSSPERQTPSSATARLQLDGSFTLRNLLPIPHSFEITGPLLNVYVKSIQLGGQDASDGRIDLAASAGPLNLMLAQDGGEISGSVKSAAGDPAAGVIAVVASKDRPWRRDLVHELRTDNAGNFRCPSLAPGEYLVFALEDTNSNLWSAEYRGMFENRAVSVTVQANGKKSVELKLITAEEMDEMLSR